MLTPVQADQALRRLRIACLGRDAGERVAVDAWLRDLTAPELLRIDGRARFFSYARENPLEDAGHWNPALVRADVLAACAASMHPDGQLRERAVRRLAGTDDPLADRFLAMRAVDHVPLIRAAAMAALIDRAAAPGDASVPRAARVLGVLLRVQTRHQGAEALARYAAASGAPGSLGPIGELVWVDDAVVRRFAYGAVLAGDAGRRPSSSDLAGLVDAETDQWSRRLLAEHWARLDPTAARDVLLHGRYVEGRLIALSLIPEECFGREDLERRMLDRSPRVRAAAQWRYRRAGHDAAAFYLSRWEIGDGETIDRDRILDGLRETGQRLSEQEARAALASPHARDRIAAVRLWPTDPPPEALLLDLLSDPSPAVVRLATQQLSHLPTVRYDDLAAAAGDDQVGPRRAAWQVRRRLGGWSRVRGDLEAMLDADPTLAEPAEADLRIWLVSAAASTYARLLPSEKEAIAGLLNEVELEAHLIEQIAFHAGIARSRSGRDRATASVWIRRMPGLLPVGLYEIDLPSADGGCERVRTRRPRSVLTAFVGTDLARRLVGEADERIADRQPWAGSDDVSTSVV
ncbi:hypothetical protein [Nocardioides sp. GXZ039]|uniref:hypothetical protein n=1 Tax=Nocardioides sp. GXZ039 TaxID=3136018 RepID=UPI0030F38CED